MSEKELLDQAVESITAALVAAGVPCDHDDGRVSIYGEEGWELRVWPRGPEGYEDHSRPVHADLVLDRKLEIDPYDGQRRLWFDPLEAEGLGHLRAETAEDIQVLVGAVKAILHTLPGEVT